MHCLPQPPVPPPDQLSPPPPSCRAGQQATTNIVEALIVGIFSGIAIGLAQSSGIASALAGVAMSASLLPPVVNSGLMLVFALVYPDVRTIDGFLLYQVAIVSFELYFVNVVSIVIFCVRPHIV
eukprot:SAG22_NODE_52_length_24288_cov_15.594568_4_plen_124_part_00